MTEISNINVRQATTDPEAVFGSPSELVASVGLTRGQKISALEKWAFNVRARVDALSEGMLNHPDGAYARDVESLGQIENVLEGLRSGQSAS